MGKTRREFLKKAGVAAAAGAGVVLTGNRRLYAKDEDKVFKWKMATSWTTGMPLYTHMARVLPDVVKKMSNGRLIIDIFPAGAIVPALEGVDATRRGVCQIAHTWPGYDIGISKGSAVIGGFAGSPNSEVMMHWIYSGGGYKLWQDYRREVFNVIAFPGGMRPTEVFAHSHKPVRSLADFKGFKMRTVGAWADILPKLGGSVITLPGGEVLPALQQKVIDATEWACAGENLSMGFHEVAKYVIIPGIHQPSAPFEYVVNVKAWEELPADLKAIVEGAAKIATLDSWTYLGALDMGAMDVFKKKGNTIIELDVDVQKAAYKLGLEWGREAAAKDPWTKKLFESQIDFHKKWEVVEATRSLKY